MSSSSISPSDVFIVGGGIAPFRRPGLGSYQEMAHDAISSCLTDFCAQHGIREGDLKNGAVTDFISAAVCSYNYGAPTCGQAAVHYAFEKITGSLPTNAIPMWNVNNNCCAG